MASEEIPLWEAVTQPLASVLNRAFWCHHTKLSRVFSIDGHTYKVCCSCGAHFEYSLRSMSITRHRKLFPALRRLRASRIHRQRKTLRRSARTE